jgi:DNA-binding response OmpR family regulator
MKPLKILVIDDERVICDACELVLGEAGHSVDWCLTGEAGWRAIKGGDFDLVLLDLKLPDIDGTSVLERVRGRARPPRIIVMTGYATIPSALQTMKLGATDYLAKPFTDNELMETIQRVFL